MSALIDELKAMIDRARSKGEYLRNADGTVAQCVLEIDARLAVLEAPLPQHSTFVGPLKVARATPDHMMDLRSVIEIVRDLAALDFYSDATLIALVNRAKAEVERCR